MSCSHDTQNIQPVTATSIATLLSSRNSTHPPRSPTDRRLQREQLASILEEALDLVNDTEQYLSRTSALEQGLPSRALQ